MQSFSCSITAAGACSAGDDDEGTVRFVASAPVSDMAPVLEPVRHECRPPTGEAAPRAGGSNNGTDTNDDAAQRQQRSTVVLLLLLRPVRGEQRAIRVRLSRRAPMCRRR